MGVTVVAGASLAAAYRQMAVYVGRILHSAVEIGSIESGARSRYLDKGLELVDRQVSDRHEGRQALKARPA